GNIMEGLKQGIFAKWEAIKQGVLDLGSNIPTGLRTSSVFIHRRGCSPKWAAIPWTGWRSGLRATRKRRWPA
ncbi:hypothetical protein ACQCZM_28145, partial [Escherichia coli]|uniref:hypothetical protein n=1 Tax=Escherichia coli TaxID=562 RepID=UPI003CE90DCD